MLIAASSRARNVSKSQRQRRLDTRLSMYTTPPGQDLSLDDFESYAYDRLTGRCSLSLYDFRAAVMAMQTSHTRWFSLVARK